MGSPTHPVDAAMTISILIGFLAWLNACMTLAFILGATSHDATRQQRAVLLTLAAVTTANIPAIL